MVVPTVFTVRVPLGDLTTTRTGNVVVVWYRREFPTALQLRDARVLDRSCAFAAAVLVRPPPSMLIVSSPRLSESIARCTMVHNLPINVSDGQPSSILDILCYPRLSDISLTPRSFYRAVPQQRHSSPSCCICAWSIQSAAHGRTFSSPMARRSTATSPPEVVSKSSGKVETDVTPQKRGHITRQLYDELKAAVNGGD